MVNKNWELIRKEHCKNRRERAKREGLCIQCLKNAPEDNRVRCAQCSAYHRQNSSKYNLIKKIKRICICGNKLPEGKSICLDCKNKRKEKVDKWKNEKRCTVCGSESIVNPDRKMTFCERHYFLKKTFRLIKRGDKKFAMLLKDKFNQQEGICPFTKKKLILGVNASVDHILPKSKHPLLVDDINNLQWVDKNFNTSKGTKKSSEYFERMRELVKNYDDFNSQNNKN